MSDIFPPGKLPPEVLKGLLAKLPSQDERVLVGPRIGEDAAVIHMGDRYLVAKTDPITFATDRIAWYLVHINANDIACMGAEPKWLLVTCLLPENHADAQTVEGLFDDISTVCRDLGITVCGGHTEVTLGLDRPILVGHLLGEVSVEGFVDKQTICPGDRLLLTKGIAIEGTCVIARERVLDLKDRVSEEVLDRAKDMLSEPGISVIQDARIAVSVAGDHLHGMHDPTEGGLIQGVRELADRADVGVRIERDKIPVLPETRILCEVLGIDPMGLLASGALLLAVAPGYEEKVRLALSEEGIPCTQIGEIRSAAQGLDWVCEGQVSELPTFPRDELVKVFEQ